MLKRILCLSAVIVSLASFSATVAEAQARKPSQALRQVNEEEERVLLSFDKDLGRGKAQPYEWEERTEILKRFAAQRAQAFKVADWTGGELRALAALYQTAEMFGPAVDAFRAFLKEGPRGQEADAARSSLIRALIETERAEEAEKELEDWSYTPRQDPAVLVARVGLHQDLALLLRDRGKFDRAAYQARNGYNAADSVNFSRGAVAQLQDLTQRSQMALAALAIAAFEQAGKKAEGEALSKLVEKYDFARQPSLKSLYEKELVIARLIGRPAPELVVSRWLDTAGMAMSDLRGKVALLDFWAMWCSPCIAAYPHLRGMQTKYESRGFQVVGVTRYFGRSDAEESLKRDQELKSLENYKVKHKLTWPVAIGKMDDPTNDEAYGVTALPTVILIDRQGRVRHVKRGIGEYQKLEKQIERLLDEKSQ
ncbi:MAG: TlpA disulfide reductase family protein [Blastocatellia bacterium]|nr:TlpA disulfide reductase family protein [Blastocatellia bacterium]